MCTSLAKYKNKTLSCLINIKYFPGPRKGRKPEIYASVLEYFEDLRNNGLPVTRETLMSKQKNMLETVK
jgi:hypothetical protein